MTFGITPYHIKRLIENSWEGGNQYTPDQVGNMTLDQILFALSDRKNLRKTDGSRTTTMQPLQATSIGNKDGLIKGRAKDGTPIKGRIRGKSVARQLMEKEEERLKKEKKKKGRRK